MLPRGTSSTNANHEKGRRIYSGFVVIDAYTYGSSTKGSNGSNR